MGRVLGSFAVSLAVFLAVACGGGGDKGAAGGQQAVEPETAVTEPAPGRETEDEGETAAPSEDGETVGEPTGETGATGGPAQALRSLNEDDLALMVLPAADLGAEAAGLEIDEDSGFVDNEETADDSLDPEDTADDLERAGRSNGYDLDYSDENLSALEAGEGVLRAGTGVDLFEDVDKASAFIAKQLADFERFEGEEPEPGISVVSVETFPVEALADESVGLMAVVGIGEARTYATGVVFRLDRLVGEAFLIRADAADASGRVEELARALERRIEGVLLGDVTGSPVPIPEPDEEGQAETTAAPPGAPDLAAMALSLDDLPAGVSVESEGYVEDEATLSSYHREFDLGAARVGDSELIGLRCEIDLFEAAALASAVLAAIEGLAESEGAAELFAQAFAEGAGFDAESLSVELVAIPDVGDEAKAMHASFDTPLGEFESYFVFFAVDRAVGSLFAAAPKGKIALADVVPLARAAAARMAAVLAGEA